MRVVFITLNINIHSHCRNRNINVCYGMLTLSGRICDRRCVLLEYDQALNSEMQSGPGVSEKRIFVCTRVCLHNLSLWCFTAKIEVQQNHHDGGCLSAEVREMEEGNDMGKVPSTSSYEPRVSHSALSQTHYGKQDVGGNLWRVEKSSWEDKEYFKAVALAVSKTGSLWKHRIIALEHLAGYLLLLSSGQLTRNVFMYSAF